MDPTTTDSLLNYRGTTVDALTPSDSQATTKSLDEPTVILICSWLGAKLPTLRKYADGFRELYPSSAQVIVSADPRRYWKFESARERAVLPAIRKLDELGVLFPDPQAPPPKILVHVMSNGGAMSLTDIASVLRKRGIQPVNGTKCAIVFDSAPAPASLVLAVRAYTAGIRGRFQRYLVAIPLSIVWCLSWLLLRITFTPEPLRRAIGELNNPRLLPWTSKATPRLYLYSAGDRIVPEKHVEEHAAKAKMVGFPVKTVHFDKSAHVSHARDYPDKYWGAIQKFWDEVVKQ